MTTGKAVWPGEHWKKSKQVCREMEKELGLKTPVPRRVKQMLAIKPTSSGNKNSLVFLPMPNPAPPYWILPPRPTIRPEAPERPMLPNLPSGGGSLPGMSEAQRIDFIAACEGKITWRQYFEKWGHAGPTF